MPKENEAKEKAFSKGIFRHLAENHDEFPKIAPRFHDFLTQINHISCRKKNGIQINDMI